MDAWLTAWLSITSSGQMIFGGRGGTAMQNSTTIQNRIMKLTIKDMPLPVNGR